MNPDEVDDETDSDEEYNGPLPHPGGYSLPDIFKRKIGGDGMFGDVLIGPDEDDEDEDETPPTLREPV